jgi:hypothetical protein
VIKETKVGIIETARLLAFEMGPEEFILSLEG